MTGPRRPDSRMFRIAVAAALFVSVAYGVIFFYVQTRSRSFRALPEEMREELVKLQVPADASAAVERAWVREGFGGEPEYLIAPVGPLPCDGDTAAAKEAIASAGNVDQLSVIADRAPDDLLVALVFGTELIRAGRYAEADRVIAQTLARTGDDENVIAAARDPRTQLDLSDDRVSTVIHLHHALGVARLQSGTTPPWISLKNVIGCVKPLSARRLIGTSRGAPSWSRLQITAPGCTTNAAGTLSSYDLYNNLIAGYMRAARFEGDDRMREREFSRRARTNPTALHELLLAQVERAKANGWQNEAQLWALSNVEQILDERIPDDARLNLNAIHVIDWWLEGDRCPAEVCTADLRARLARTKDELLEQAMLRRNVAPEQQRAFAQMTTRLLAGSGVPRARVAAAANAVRGWLATSQSATLHDLAAADDARNAIPRSVVIGDESEPPEARFGPRGEEWRAAAEKDFAAAVAKWAATRSPGEQRDLLIATRKLLGGDDAPRAVVDLEQKRGDAFAIRLAASRRWWAFLALL
ncbi:MAG TPA: hypothetical protein VHK90_11915, partial [Thermoanaerobaculia bacterium]|nr:hypothetical protein [Thermoanaerobaculia bacterium]